MLHTTDAGENASVALPSNHRTMTDSNHVNEFGTSAATATTTTSSSCNTHTTSLTNSGTMIRNRPTTMTSTMALTSTAALHSTDDIETPQPLPPWTLNTTERTYNTKSSIHHNNDIRSNHSHNNSIETTNPSNTANENNQNDSLRYPLREIQFYIHGLQDPIVINPMVSLYAIVLLWSVVIWTIGTYIVRWWWLR
jgi:hypothetical protein